MSLGKPIYGKPFFLLALSSFFFFMSFNMILPELYGFLEEMGGADYKAFIIALFTLTAAVSRPFSGRMADKLGRNGVMIFGSAVSCICAVCYIYIEEVAAMLPLAITPVALFLALRLVHGMSTGFKPTGTAAYLSDIIPDNKRGEAMGWLGFFGSIGMALGPMIGNYLHLNHGYPSMFWTSSGVALLSLIVVYGLKETLPVENRSKRKASTVFGVKRHDIYEPLVKSPTLTFFLYAFAFGTVYTLVPDLTAHKGWDEERGIFFGIYVGCTTITRVLAGKASDLKGRVPVITVGLCLIVLSMTILAYADELWILYMGGALFGMAHGITGPTLFAWTTDLSNPERRGRAFSTMFIGMEFGIGGGALLSFAIYRNDPNYFSWAFLSCAVLALLALLYLYSIRNTSDNI